MVFIVWCRLSFRCLLPSNFPAGVASVPPSMAAGEEKWVVLIAGSLRSFRGRSGCESGSRRRWAFRRASREGRDGESAPPCFGAGMRPFDRAICVRGSACLWAGCRFLFRMGGLARWRCFCDVITQSVTDHISPRGVHLSLAGSTFRFLAKEPFHRTRHWNVDLNHGHIDLTSSYPELVQTQYFSFIFGRLFTKSFP